MNKAANSHLHAMNRLPRAVDARDIDFFLIPDDEWWYHGTEKMYALRELIAKHRRRGVAYLYYTMLPDQQLYRLQKESDLGRVSNLVCIAEDVARRYLSEWRYVFTDWYLGGEEPAPASA